MIESERFRLFHCRISEEITWERMNSLLFQVATWPNLLAWRHGFFLIGAIAIFLDFAQ